MILNAVEKVYEDCFGKLYVCMHRRNMLKIETNNLWPREFKT